MTRVAVDLEEVLADTIAESCRSTDKLSIDQFKTWDLDSYEWQVYSGVSDALWRHDPLSIPLVEDGAPVAVNDLFDRSTQLDIVSARMHVDDQIQRWLSYHGMQYDQLISTRRPKYELDYDLFIDDNPEMHGYCRLLLRDHEHNRQIDASNSKMTDRILRLSDAVQFVQ